MEKTIELEHRGITLRAPHKVVVDSILERLQGKRLTPVFCAVGDIPDLGEVWPGEGGIRAAECRSDDGRIYDLVVVTGTDGKPIIFKDREWGTYGTEIKGADSLRDGWANTKAMADAGSALAKEMSTAIFDDHPDCYLPALCELTQVFANLGHLFEKEVFWSSTQFSANTAWYQHFASGFTDTWLKHLRGRALVVRRVYR